MSFKSRLLLIFRIPSNLVLLAIVHGFEHFCAVSLPALFLLFQKDFDLTFASLGTLVFIRGILSLFQPLAGILVDRWGGKILLSISCTILGFSALGLSLSPTFLSLLFFQLIQGVGSISIHPASYSLIGKLDIEQPMGRRMSIQTFGGFFGSASSFVIMTFFGSHFGWRITLALLSILGFLFTYLIHRIHFSLVEEKVTSIDEKNCKNERAPEESPLKEKTPSYMPLIIIIVVAAFHGIFSHSLSSFLPTFLSVNYGKTVSEAGFLSSILYYTALIGLLFGGEIADRVNRVNLISIFSLFASILFLLLSLLHFPTVLLVILLIVIGFSVYFVIPARHLLTMEVAQKGKEGRTFGFTFGLSFGGGAIAAPFLGYLADIFSIRVAFASILSTSTLLIALIILSLKKWGYGIEKK